MTGRGYAWVVALLLVMGTPATARADNDETGSSPVRPSAIARTDGFDLRAATSTPAPKPVAPGGPDAGPATVVAQRRPWLVCGDQGRSVALQACLDDSPTFVAGRVCADGTPASDPLWRRELRADGVPLTPWVRVDNGGCPEDPDVEVVLSAADFARLPIAPSPVRLQPADGVGLVNMPLIVLTDPAPQTLTTTVLGVPVTVVATPASYLWDFGDGTTLTTTDPGRPYPDHTTTGTYTAPGTYTLTLTTTWTGTYQVNGTGPWQPVAGTATTTSPPVTTTAVEAHSQLIAPTG